jgi:O-antigen/teichoic acid export membrane protein
MILSRQDYRNIVVLLIAQAVSVLIGVFAFVKIGLVLPVAELGLFGFVTATTVFFGLLAELGTRYVAMREIAIEPARAKQVFHHSMVVRALLSIISLALLLFLTLIIGPWQNEKRLIMFAGMVAVTSFGADPATWVLFGKGRVDSGGYILIIDRFLYLIGVNVAAFLTRSAEGIVLGALTANFVRTFISWMWIRPTLSSVDNYEWDLKLFKRLLVASIALGIAVIASVSYSEISIIAVQISTSVQELGYYSIALGVISILIVVPTSLLIALFPTLSRMLAQGRMVELYYQVAWLNLVTLLPLAVGLALFADQVIFGWVGPIYTPAIIILRVLSVSMIASALSFMYRLFLFAMNKPWLETFVDALGILLILGLGIPIAHVYGGLGVALLFMVVEILLTVIKIIMTRHWLGWPPYFQLMLRALLATVIPAAFTLFPGERILLRLISYVVGSVVLMFLFKVVNFDQLREIIGQAKALVSSQPVI